MTVSGMTLDGDKSQLITHKNGKLCTVDYRATGSSEVALRRVAIICCISRNKKVRLRSHFWS